MFCNVLFIREKSCPTEVTFCEASPQNYLVFLLYLIYWIPVVKNVNDLKKQDITCSNMINFISNINQVQVQFKY